MRRERMPLASGSSGSGSSRRIRDQGLPPLLPPLLQAPVQAVGEQAAGLVMPGEEEDKAVAVTAAVAAAVVAVAARGSLGG